MNAKNPPKLATWVLTHLDLGTHGDSLAGDLLEQYAQGRSRLWYWRQVGVAVWIHTWRRRPHGRRLAFTYLAWGEVVITVGVILVAAYRLAPSRPYALSVLIPLSVSLLFTLGAGRGTRAKAVGRVP